MKHIPHFFEPVTLEEALKGLKERREFLKRNNPAHKLKRQAELDEAADEDFRNKEAECDPFDEDDDSADKSY